MRPPDGRGTRPVFQKYDSSDLVNLFLADPQKSLKFLDEDHVQDVTAGAFMFPILSKVTSTRVASPSPVRKLFLDVHKRFYLVTCELRCEAAGFMWWITISRSTGMQFAAFPWRMERKSGGTFIR